ncbi:MAG: phenylalanine--tRNA ligase subunit beta [Ignavibacteria bacterium]|nr:phenylalanine--tRNA ligase subunit beta [Ignavibacteria bacterium]
MKVLQSWLQQYIEFSLPPDEFADKLSKLGLEFEGVERTGEEYNGFVVGKVLERTQHPNAEKLSICKVNVGTGTLQIVCGAPNVAAGQKVAVGMSGAIVPRNQHDPSGKPLPLSTVKIRGIESSGMICSEYELDLGKDADNILVLESNAKIGKPLAEYLGVADIVYDIETTPNRPDWLSHIGIAREIGAIVGRKPKLPKLKLKEAAIPVSKHLTVKVQDTQNCYRFAVRMICGLKVEPSPRWLQNALKGLNLRPVNSVVDVTNYVMMECGQPLHPFDYALLKGKQIIVRQTKRSSSFITLDGQERKLPDGVVMVCDAEREVSIAGVMGGANSEISDSTVDIVLESAYWNPSSIRRTSKLLGVSTDASQRFERGADPDGVLYGLNRAAQLIVDMAGGELLKGVIDIYPRKVKERFVPLRPERVNLVLGTKLTTVQTVRLLRLLDIVPTKRGSKRLMFRVPSYRVDITREIDLIEEVGRVYGYDKIEDKTTATVDFAHFFPKESHADHVREKVIGLGFCETITNSMQETKKAILGGATPARISNPQNREMDTLRTSLVPGLLDVVARNFNYGNNDLRLFEIGHVFSRDESERPKLVENFLEEQRLCLLMTGMVAPRHWGSPSTCVNIFDVKGKVIDLLEQNGLDKGKFISYSTSDSLVENRIALEINGTYGGYLGLVRAEVLNTFGIGQEVFVAELNLELLAPTDKSLYEPLPRFPKVKRDLGFIVDVGISAEGLQKSIKEFSSGLLQGIELFDVYQGDQLPAGKKSLAFSLELMSPDKTLTDAEIDTEVRNIVTHVQDRFNALLRSVERST